MANPFPGMNPYLKDPAFWPGFHSALINAIADKLNSALPAGFTADVEERSFQDWEQGLDLLRHPFINILLTNGAKNAVSTVEVLCPSNKVIASEPRHQYQLKQQHCVDADINLLEIDLLRGGEHALHIQHHELEQANGGNFDYAVCLHRSGDGHRWATWRRTVRQPLPNCLPVPLTAGRPDTSFDLQALVNQVYVARRYADRIDYREDPILPFPLNDAEWANDLLHRKNLR